MPNAWPTFKTSDALRQAPAEACSLHTQVAVRRIAATAESLPKYEGASADWSLFGIVAATI
jgi:hypothetical protein